MSAHTTQHATTTGTQHGQQAGADRRTATRTRTRFGPLAELVLAEVHLKLERQVARKRIQVGDHLSQPEEQSGPLNTNSQAGSHAQAWQFASAAPTRTEADRPTVLQATGTRPQVSDVTRRQCREGQLTFERHVKVEEHFPGHFRVRRGDLVHLQTHVQIALLQPQHCSQAGVSKKQTESKASMHTRRSGRRHGLQLANRQRVQPELA